MAYTKKKVTEEIKNIFSPTKIIILFFIGILVSIFFIIYFSKQKQVVQQYAQTNVKIYFGAALGLAGLADAGTVNILKKYGFTSITPENELKMDTTQPTATSFNYTNADQLISFAKNNNMAIHAHTLVWHNQIPSWVYATNYTSDQLANILKNRITTLMRHYSGKFYSWDVVNEALDDNQSGTGYQLRTQSVQNIWSKINTSTMLANSGYPDYVTLAFAWARQIDQNHTVKLYYNDYGIEDSTTPKGKAAFALVKQLYSKKLIDGIGLQMHVGAYIADAVGWHNKVANTIAQYASLGSSFEVAVSEMDVTVDNNSFTQQQANIYDAVAKACVQNIACKRFTTWGVTDKISWLNPDTNGKNWYPLLFDNNYNPKNPAWNYVKNDLSIAR